MKFRLLLIVALLGFVSYRFVSDSNPAKNVDSITALSEDFSFDVIKSEVSSSPIAIVGLMSYSPLVMVEMVEILPYTLAKKVRTLEGFTSDIDKPPKYIENKYRG